MNSKIKNTEKDALLLKHVNDRPNAAVTYGKGKLNSTDTKDLFDKQFELVVQRHNDLCDEIDEELEKRDLAIEKKHTEQDNKIKSFGETVAELGANVTKFDNRVTNLEGRADSGEFKGDKGERGRGIVKGRTKILFAKGGSTQQPPSEAEYDSDPAVADGVKDGNYLWIKIVYEFTDNTEEAVTIPVRFGNKGDPFGVSKVYSSVEEMNAGFATDGLPEGSFVMINTDVEDTDNAKVYVKAADGYNFTVDLSGSPGIQGPKPVKGVDYFTPADRAEMVQDVLNALPNGDEVSY